MSEASMAPWGREKRMLAFFSERRRANERREYSTLGGAISTETLTPQGMSLVSPRRLH